MTKREQVVVVVFRALILLAAISFALTIYLDIHWAEWVSASSRMHLAMGWRGEGSIFSEGTIRVGYVVIPALTMVAYVGLFFFVSAARYLLVALLVEGLVVSTLDGLAVTIGLLTLTASSIWLIEGALVAMAFLPPLAERFSRRSAAVP
jgi:hypothetical protein